MSIADALIQKHNRQYTPGSVPDGYFVDDLGYWVEIDIKSDRAKYAEYLLFRILKLHHNIYKRYGVLYCGHNPIHGTTDEILKLVDLPWASVKGGQAAWIYNRLMEMAPEIDETKLVIAPGIFWDVREAEIRDLDELTKYNTVR